MADNDGKPDANTGSNPSGNSGQGDGTAGSGPTFFDPGSVGKPAASGTSDPGNSNASGERRGRGRPRGSGGKTKPDETPQDNVKRAPLSVDGVSAILISIHQMLAGFTAVPELEIQEEEAKKMGDAIKRVADLYEILPTEKSLAWANLATATAMVYGTRVFAFRMRKAGERADRAEPKPPPNAHRPTIVPMG